MSHHYWQPNGKSQKKKFVCLENGYHGETLGALAVTDVAIFREAYGSLLQDVYTVMSPDARKAINGENAEAVANKAAMEIDQLFAKEHEHILQPLLLSHSCNVLAKWPCIRQNICAGLKIFASVIKFT